MKSANYLMMRVDIIYDKRKVSTITLMKIAYIFIIGSKYSQVVDWLVRPEPNYSTRFSRIYLYMVSKYFASPPLLFYYDSMPLP